MLKGHVGRRVAEAGIAIVYSGVSYQRRAIDSQPFLKELLILPIYNLPGLDLSAYKALIFPRGTDQEFMFLMRQKMRQFLDGGGIVVAFGEISEKWLPSCRWHPAIPADNELPILPGNHPILKGLRSEDLRWHKGLTKMCSHGHFSAPSASEVLVQNTKGNAIAYIDRSSTNGTIVAMSNLDAFCHASLGEKGAVRLLRNLITWLRVETKRIEKPLERPSPRIAVLYSGVKINRDAFALERLGHPVELVNAFMFPQVNICDFDILVVPRESSQEVLVRTRSKIRQFLDNGKTLIAFGEVTRPWLRDCKWFDNEVDVQALRMPNPSHPLFRGLEKKDIQWHAHGTFQKLPGVEVLIEEESGGVIMYVDRRGHDGTILATTLDPEFHVGYGSNRTLKILKSIIEWAIEDFIGRTEGGADCGEPSLGTEFRNTS
jgi:hypothetical protein